jgi:hypothetical protein
MENRTNWEAEIRSEPRSVRRLRFDLGHPPRPKPPVLPVPDSKPDR